MNAEILESGAILLGENIACDAYAETSVRIVTHAHWDHMKGLKESLEKCMITIATPATRDLISVLKTNYDKIHPLAYGQPLEWQGEIVTLYPAGHIMGSAQVLLESHGRRLVYTGDFKFPGAEVIPADVLVMEATYGHPSHSRPFEERVEEELVSLVESSLKLGPVYIFGYHGKLQETMRILTKAGIRVPIIVPEKVYHVAEVCRKHGMKLGGYLHSLSQEAKETIKNREYIGIYHMRAKKYVGKDSTRIYLSGWEFLEPIRRVSDREYVAALSDHSDFQGLINYVEESKPELVITDNHRVGDAITLAEEIKKRLNIKAIAMPIP